MEYCAYHFKHSQDATAVALKIKTALALYHMVADYGVMMNRTNEAILVLVAGEKRIMSVMKAQVVGGRRVGIGPVIESYLRRRGYRP